VLVAAAEAVAEALVVLDQDPVVEEEEVVAVLDLL
jgi:hypothetical protein